jgi:hypothetical protein
MESADLLCGFYHASHLFLTASIRLADIRAVYPDFESVFAKHVKDARFNGIPSRSRQFKALKLGMISLWRLQSENRRMRREARSELIQALVVEKDFQGAFQVIQRSSSIFTRVYSLFRSDPSGAELFKIEMQKHATTVSDSQFLQMLEKTNEEDLRSAAQTAKSLALTELLSAIDGVVEKVAKAVLIMQQGHCERRIRHQVETEEREVLAVALVEFIREINKKSAGGENS